MLAGGKLAFSRCVLERKESNGDLLVWGVVDRLELFIPLKKNVLCSDHRFLPPTVAKDFGYGWDPHLGLCYLSEALSTQQRACIALICHLAMPSSLLPKGFSSKILCFPGGWVREEG